MRAALGLLALAIHAGCGSDATTSGDATPPTFFPMWIVVSDGAVEMYTNGADRTCACTEIPLPDAGSCTFLHDYNQCELPPGCDSCITEFAIEADGQLLTQAAAGAHDPWRAVSGPFPAGSLSLVLEGCGHPTTRIPLDGPPFPQATLVADYVAGKPHVGWTTDTPISSTLVTMYGGTHGELCHVAGASDYTFTDWDFADSAYVQPLGARTDVPTSFGPATIWRAGAAAAQFPDPP